jgi:carbonic anhydrase
MSIIDQALKANERYAKTYGCEVGERTTTAEDRGRDLRGSASFGPAGDSWTEASRHRRNPNRGPNATEDVLAELIVSTRVLGSKEIMLLNHTGCGFTAFADAKLNSS